MRTYETVFVLKPTLSADEQTKHIDFYKDNIVNHGGEIINVELWGKQSLAYPIENLTEGIYVLIQFKAENGYTDDELEKRFKFNEDVMRYVVVMIDEKKFKLKPRKEPVRRERPAGDKGAPRPRRDDEAEGAETEETGEPAEQEDGARTEDEEK